MAMNFNIVSNFSNIFNSIEYYWTRRKGLLLILILEAVFLYYFRRHFHFPSTLYGIIVYLGVAAITIVIWLVSSKRVLFRSAGLVMMWLSLASSAVLAFYFLVYPRVISYSSVDFPFIRVWGSVIVFIFILFVGLVLDCFVFKDRKLLIVFAVNNESIAVERTIRSSIEPVVDRIKDRDERVRLVVLPFGVIKSLRSSIRYIKQPLTRADAIVFASVIDGSDGNPAEYVFTGFSSRINENRFIRYEQKNTMHNDVLEVHYHYKQWNFLNSANDNCSRKIVISDNLESMLRMYIGCIYLMKHDFKSALPYTNVAFYTENRNSPTYNVAASLYSYALLSSARVLENEDREYDAALEQLTDLNNAMPYSSNDPAYNKAMARVMFYKGDLKASESYTRRFKDLPDHRWGYELNMGFYAINRKRIIEFVQHYKNLRKYYPFAIEEVNFAISFLERQKKESNDPEYQVLLRMAIAFLTLYKSPKKAQRIISKVDYQSPNPRLSKAISDLMDIIIGATIRWDTSPSKKKS